ncbi:uncharacterized protein LOC129797528 isoform X2 [Lutzomyia longipalpis]|uniref:uncharacterized protein LOC129797528 isoform X2 n=1 Tax=Lutzomyia longipalpis TaxID=7200 RepID=UPI00248381A5|nr:uncharacterized protein LOC129797528 isoform X2 [Lutzomyia longipalpis]
MSRNFHCNQFECEFRPVVLSNWEVPKKNVTRPRHRRGPTRVIANDRGHLLKPSRSLINRTSSFASQNGTGHKEKNNGHCPNISSAKTHRKDSSEGKNTKGNTFPEIAGEPQVKQKSEDKLSSRNPTEQGNHSCARKTNPEISEPTNSAEVNNSEECGSQGADRCGKNTIAPLPSIIQEANNLQSNDCVLLGEFEKEDPHGRSSEMDATYCNFLVARKMAQENLEHQPLPDAVMDCAYRKLQAGGDLHPGLALDVIPLATGVGVKSYKAGPTQCTKMRVYRPKTCGVTPQPLDKAALGYRPHSSITIKDKMGPMDLAICWDYRPSDPRDEPLRPTHIDGSNGSVAPAVFTLVKTPRDNTPMATGRSGGVFSSTMREEGFFDKDVLKQKTEMKNANILGRTCCCGEGAGARSRSALTMNVPAVEHPTSRPKSVSRAAEVQESKPLSRTYKSSPNLVELTEGNQNECKLVCIKHTPILVETKRRPSAKPQRPMRLCEYTKAMEAQQQHGHNNVRSDSSGNSDSGCGQSISSNGSAKYVKARKAVKVPKPRDPYAKKNYNIETLAPPFACWRGGAGQGGYPEIWRLASVYQHAYKPIEQRKRTLLATVYQ